MMTFLSVDTVLVIIKLKYFQVPVRSQSVSGKLKCYRYFTMFCDIKERYTLLGVSPGSKICTTFLNIAKYLKTVRCGCGNCFNFLKFSTVTG